MGRRQTSNIGSGKEDKMTFEQFRAEWGKRERERIERYQTDIVHLRNQVNELKSDKKDANTKVCCLLYRIDRAEEKYDKYSLIYCIIIGMLIGLVVFLIA